MNLKIDVIMIIAAFLIGYVLSYIIKYKLIEGQRSIEATNNHIKLPWIPHRELGKFYDRGVKKRERLTPNRRLNRGSR